MTHRGGIVLDRGTKFFTGRKPETSAPVPGVR